ncbi:hypothetical protein F4777DRAFT_553226 [Nemania sp. FL0916]|nr:hypothetical protein F4777DRAFT_553226 [Nemania sp. FL0916]
MDPSQAGGPSPGHTRSRSAAKASRPRSSTKGPLDIDDNTAAALSAATGSQNKHLSGATSQNASPRTSLNLPQTRSAVRSPVRPSAAAAQLETTPLSRRDLSFLQKPEIYHQISPLTVPTAFRSPQRQPNAETPIAELLAQGHFRAAAIAAAQQLSGTGGAARPAVAPTDHARIFDLVYVRLACLCLMDAVPLAAQEAKALEDLNSAFYHEDVHSGAHTHLAPWPLRTLVVRLQTIGFGDPRRAVMSYYELARDARHEIANATEMEMVEIWKQRLADLGMRVAGALIEMDDLAAAAAHLASLPDADARTPALATSRALLWLHIGDVDAARRCVAVAGAHGTAAEEETTAVRVVDALADMADGRYPAALDKWRALREEMKRDGVEDEMVGVNQAVCLLYTGRMAEVWFGFFFSFLSPSAPLLLFLLTLSFLSQSFPSQSSSSHI